MRRVLLLLVVIAGSVTLIPGEAMACTCVWQEPTVMAKHRDMAFEAVVTDKTPHTNTFSVKAVYKGDLRVGSTIIGKATNYLCGNMGALSQGERVTIFADDVDRAGPSDFAFDGCNVLGPEFYAEGFGLGPPVEGNATVGFADPPWSAYIGIGIAAGLMLLGGLTFVIRRSRRQT